jgi:hypothetical protein
MTGPKLAVSAALVCAAGWLTKMAVMIGNDGPDEASVPEAVAFFVGLAGFVVFAAATGSTLARGRRTAAVVAAAAAGVVVGVVVLGVVQLLLSALPGDAWWQPETAFVVGALGALAVSAVVVRRVPATGSRDHG